MDKPVEVQELTPEPDLETVSREDTSVQDVMQRELETSTQQTETTPKPKAKRGRVALIILGIVFVAGITYGTYSILHAMQVKNNTSNVKTNSTQTETAQKAPATSTDTTIDSSLDDIDSRMTESTTDQVDASSAVSDSDQQITIPTE